MVLLAGMFSAWGTHAQNANLSGTWKLNVAKSFMGSDHPF